MEADVTGKFFFLGELRPRPLLLLFQALLHCAEGVLIRSVWQWGVRTIAVHRQRHVCLRGDIYTAQDTNMKGKPRLKVMQFTYGETLKYAIKNLNLFKGYESESVALSFPFKWFVCARP